MWTPKIRPSPRFQALGPHTNRLGFRGTGRGSEVGTSFLKPPKQVRGWEFRKRVGVPTKALCKRVGGISVPVNRLWCRGVPGKRRSSHEGLVEDEGRAVDMVHPLARMVRPRPQLIHSCRLFTTRNCVVRFMYIELLS